MKRTRLYEIGWAALETRTKAIAAVVALFIMLGGVKTGMDALYVTAKDGEAMQRQITNTEILILKQQKWNAENEHFRLKNEGQDRKLNPLEKERKNQLERAIEEIDNEIKLRETPTK